ncbi:hypothetical protein PDJ95_29800, partial [Bacillus cereus]|nr:hypothetical protein [Bacillus cereus]
PTQPAIGEGVKPTQPAIGEGVKPTQPASKIVESNLPTTGVKAENPYIKWIGIVCIAFGAIGAVFAVRGPAN